MNSMSEHTHNKTNDFWEKANRFFTKLGYIRAAASLHRMGYHVSARRIQKQAEKM